MRRAQLRFQLGEGITQPHRPGCGGRKYDKLAPRLDDPREAAAERGREPLREPFPPITLARGLIGDRGQHGALPLQEALDRIRGPDSC